MLERSSIVNSISNSLIQRRLSGTQPFLSLKRKINTKKNRGGLMTVCVAAIYESNSIVGVSDRMLTSGDDIEFQPEQSKLYEITRSMVAMISGDMALQTEIYLELLKSVKARIDAKPNEWLPVQFVAEDYGRIYAEIRNRRSCRDFLTPLELNHDSFIQRQQQFHPDIAQQMTVDLLNYRMPSASVIIAGIDATGAHIYTAHNGEVTCQNMIGFSCVGAGASVAQSSFMFQRYTSKASAARALYLVYAAKKRAEAVAGVGPETDFFCIGPQPGTYSGIHTDIIKDVTRIWKQNQDRAEQSWKKTEKKVDECINRIFQQTSKPSEQAEPTPVAEVKPEVEKPATEDPEKGKRGK